MSNAASTVRGRVHCAYCEREVNDRLQFQWGRVPSLYNLEDPIRWRTRTDGQVVPPWQFENGPIGAVYNCGDPAIANVVLLDCGQFHKDQSPTCQHCLGPFDGATVTIRDGKISKLGTLKRGELAPMLGPLKQYAEVFVTAASGKLVPRPDWLNHPLTADHA